MKKSSSDNKKGGSKTTINGERKKQKQVYIYYHLNELEKSQITLDDVFNELSLLFVQISEKIFDFKKMCNLTEQFKDGVASNFRIPLQTFKEAVSALVRARPEVDIRIMINFWPLFQQLFLHLWLEDWEAAIAHFYSNRKLWDMGFGLMKIPRMVDSFPNYANKFVEARYFIGYGKVGVIDENVLDLCRRLCFYLILQPRRGVKELTIEAFKCFGRNANSIENLVRFFHTVPAFILHQIAAPQKNANSENVEMEPLAVGLVRQIRNNELFVISAQSKLEMLRLLVKGITSECELGCHQVSSPLLDASLFDALLKENGSEQVAEKPYGCFVPP